MITFRDYQERAVSQIVPMFGSTRRILYQLPVGGGKTVVACGVMLRHHGRTLVLAHRVELLEQMRKAIEACGVDASRVVLSSPRKASRMSDDELSRFALVVVDEAHHAGGPVYHALLARMPDAHVLGLSASPYRSGGLRGEFDALVEGPSVAELVADGHIIAPRCWSVPEEREPDLQEVGSTGGDYAVHELERAVDKPHLVGDIVREWGEHAKGRSTLVFATSIRHAESIVTAFQEANVDARLVHGTTDGKIRELMLAEFEAGRFPVLVNVLLLTEGIDVHRIDCLVLARPTRSIVLYVQAMGRGMRPSPTGLGLIVLDHAGAVRHHGLPTKPRAWSLDPRPKGRPPASGPMAKRCQACGTMAHLSAVECAHCGAPFRRVDPDVRLSEVGERLCNDCDTAISPRSVTGLCPRCGGKKRAANWTPEQRQKVRAGASRAGTIRAAHLTAEERSELARRASAAISPDERVEYGKRHGALSRAKLDSYLASLTPEQREARSQKLRERARSLWTPERREQARLKRLEVLERTRSS